MTETSDLPAFGAPDATGTQHRLHRGSAEAVVVGLASALRRYRVGGVDLTEPYGQDVVPPAANGIQMSPWPNRVAGARWILDGVEQRLDGVGADLASRGTELVGDERRLVAV